MLRHELASLEARLSLGELQSARNLDVVPLLDVSAAPAGYLTLDQALALDRPEVTEVSEAPTVPALKVLNRRTRPSNSRGDVQRAVASIGRMTAERHTSVGVGEDVRLAGEGLVGGALIAGGTTVPLGVWAEAYL